MTTASARTNAIGNAIFGGDSGIGDIGCKTDQFKIDKADGGSSLFLSADSYSYEESKKLGDLLSHSVDSIQIIGQSIFENGTNLSQVVGLFLFAEGNRNHWEIRTTDTRYMCLQNRVYSRKIVK